MPLANVALTDTFDTWRTRTNQLVVISNQVTEGSLTTSGTITSTNTSATGAINVSAGFIRVQGNNFTSNQVTLTSNSAALTVSPVNSGRLGSTIFLNVIGSNSISDVSTSNIATANAVNTLNQSVVAGLLAGNNYTNQIGAASNTYANALSVIDRAIGNSAANSANAYTVTVGAAGNNYSIQVGAAANTYANTQTATRLANTSDVSFAGNLFFPSGNVGIGTTSPITKLDVVGDGSFRSTPNTFISISAGDGGIEISRNGGGAYIDFKNTGSEDQDCRIQSVGTTGDLDFYSGSSQRMRIDANGIVGVGTSNPSLYANPGQVVNYNSGTAAFWSVGGNVSSYIFSSNTGQIGVSGTSSNHPFAFYTNGTERARLDTSGNLQFNSGYGSVATAYGCRAWVNFNGTGTVAIRGSGNVTSITDNGGTGDYTVNFTTAMPDTNYAVTFGAQPFASGGHQAADNIFMTLYNGATILTGSVRVNTNRGDFNGGADMPVICVCVFR